MCKTEEERGNAGNGQKQGKMHKIGGKICCEKLSHWTKDGGQFGENAKLRWKNIPKLGN